MAMSVPPAVSSVNKAFNKRIRAVGLLEALAELLNESGNFERRGPKDLPGYTKGLIVHATIFTSSNRACISDLRSQEELCGGEITIFQRRGIAFIVVGDLLKVITFTKLLRHPTIPKILRIREEDDISWSELCELACAE